MESRDKAGFHYWIKGSTRFLLVGSMIKTDFERLLIYYYCALPTCYNLILSTCALYCNYDIGMRLDFSCKQSNPGTGTGRS